jgi:ATP-dependent exoDNAse (exonuclease V) beta subunit
VVQETWQALKGCQGAKEARKQLETEAALSAAAVSVATAWLPDFDEARRALRHRTFAEVLERATEIVERVSTPEDLATRFPFHHVLVDEFQDTDAAQIRFIDALVAALREGGLPTRLFTVGDPKQSIYRFRSAEVDLFEERCEGGRAKVGHLTTCFRADPQLTAAVDRIFARLFAGQTPDGIALDPAAAVPWQALSPRAPGEGDAAGPRIELLRPDEPPQGEPAAVAAEGEPDELDGSDEDAEDQDPPPNVLLERATVRRIRELLEEARARETDGRPSAGEAPVAVLCHSWARAVHYAELLREHGVPAFVQGGWGLLEVREVRDLSTGCGRSNGRTTISPSQASCAARRSGSPTPGSTASAWASGSRSASWATNPTATHPPRRPRRSRACASASASRPPRRSLR